MRASLVALITTVAAVAHLGMRGPTSTSTSTSTSTATATATSTPIPTLPASASLFPPSQLLLSGRLTGDTLTETESCAGCHADAAAQWQSSCLLYTSMPRWGDGAHRSSWRET